jgi:hypothetical protein
MNLGNFETQIAKTGFVLENQVAQHLKASGWTVISNKYYIDDLEENVREIDLVAYQVSKVKYFDLYTTVIISCKKSDANVWAFLTRDINLKDPNSDWWPLHAWSNDNVLSFQVRNQARRYYEDTKASGVNIVVDTPSVEVFAFQEMDKRTGSPQNDKSVFQAITSLMKAQAYELTSLPIRKKRPAVYQFNLVSVVGTDLVHLDFRTDPPKATEVDWEHYVARYIVQKKESFARIQFVAAQRFAQILADYNRLHQSNCSWFQNVYDEFFEDVFEDIDRTELLIEDFKHELFYLKRRVERGTAKPVDFQYINLGWDASKSLVTISVLADERVVNFVNSDEESIKRVRAALKSVYHYEGAFLFDDNYIPF